MTNSECRRLANPIIDLHTSSWQQFDKGLQFIRCGQARKGLMRVG